VQLYCLLHPRDHVVHGQAGSLIRVEPAPLDDAGQVTSSKHGCAMVARKRCGSMGVCAGTNRSGMVEGTARRTAVGVYGLPAWADATAWPISIPARRFRTQSVVA
jgi:hypothetical protein